MNRLVICAVAVMAIVLVNAQAIAQSQPRRLALVIGNDQYTHVHKLKKAVNDAHAMERELRAAGFEVSKYTNLTDRAQESAVSQFSKSIRGGDTVVVFFAGHGVQIKSGSYLLPVDIRVSSEREVEKFSLGLQEMMDTIALMRPAFTMIIVDACRNNPIAKTNGRSVGVERGLIPTEPAKGQVVVYSAGKGQTALDQLSDSDADPNGVFTREFIKRMRRPGADMRALIEEVQDGVEKLARTVGHDQRPAVYSEARGSFYFFGPASVQASTSAAMVPARPSAAEEESNFWNESKAVGNVDGYQAYLDQYPSGRYAGIARAYIKQLTLNSGAVAAATTESKAAPPPRRDEVTATKPGVPSGSAKPPAPVVASQGAAGPNTAGAVPGAGTSQDPAQLRSLGEFVNEQSKGFPDLGTDKTRSGLPYLPGVAATRIKRAAKPGQLEQLFAAYRRDAEAGDPVAQTSFGNMHDHGLGTPLQSDVAVSWYRKAAAQGYTRGQNNLAITYLTGKGGVAKDPKEAVKWYRMAADKGLGDSQVRLGGLYVDGVGVDKDEAEAVKWYRKAAEQGHSGGQNSLGFMYREGRGIERNHTEALKWFRKSVEKGNAIGQSNLGVMYMRGFGVPKDYDEAIKWFRKSAEQGHAWGKANLGYMYEQGFGVAKSDTEAKAWYQQAADSGNDFAKAQLQKLAGK